MMDQIPVHCRNPEPLSPDEFWPMVNVEELEEIDRDLPLTQNLLPLIQIDSDVPHALDTYAIGTHVLVDGQTDEGYEIWFAQVVAIYPDDNTLGVHWYNTTDEIETKLIVKAKLNDTKIAVCVYKKLLLIFSENQSRNSSCKKCKAH